MTEIINSGAVESTRIIKIKSGEDLLEAFSRAVKEEGIENAVIMTGIGSAVSWGFHVVDSCELPPENKSLSGKGAVDITSITGYVMNGRIHAHISFADDKISFGGHLEPGCEVLTFAVITLGIIDSSLTLDHLDRF